jgi:hypothetical protein
MSQCIALQGNLFLTFIFDSKKPLWDIEYIRPRSILGCPLSQSGEFLNAIKILFEIASAAVGFAFSLVFARQLDLGAVPGVFMGLMGAIFAFILAQGLTSFIFRILRRD